MRVLHLSKEYFPNEGLDRQMGRKEGRHGQEGTTKVRWAGDGYGKQKPVAVLLPGHDLHQGVYPFVRQEVRQSPQLLGVADSQ